MKRQLVSHSAGISFSPLRPRLVTAEANHSSFEVHVINDDDLETGTSFLNDLLVHCVERVKQVSSPWQRPKTRPTYRTR